jgi:hypothetical protein
MASAAAYSGWARVFSRAASWSAASRRWRGLAVGLALTGVAWSAPGHRIRGGRGTGWPRLGGGGVIHAAGCRWRW